MPIHLEKKYCVSNAVVDYVLTRGIHELESLSVKSIARELNISRYCISRCFKAEKKITLKEYLFRIKITQAVVLLQHNPDLTVKQVAEKSGYYCCDYFIRIFKRYFGITPGKYRELVTMAAGNARRP